MTRAPITAADIRAHLEPRTHIAWLAHLDALTLTCADLEALIKLAARAPAYAKRAYLKGH